jgi:hypothetical protein
MTNGARSPGHHQPITNDGGGGDLYNAQMGQQVNNGDHLQ